MRLIFVLLSLAQVVLAALLFGRSLSQRRGLRWALVAVLLISGLGWLWIGMRDLSAFETAGDVGPVPLVERQLVKEGALLGLAQGGELRVLAPAGSAGSTARLTEIGMAESVSPESGEIDLGPYEGLAVVVRGRDGGGWIYEAEIVEQGGALLTALVETLYRSGP